MFSLSEQTESKDSALDQRHCKYQDKGCAYYHPPVGTLYSLGQAMYLVMSMRSHQMHVLRLHKGTLHLSNIPVVYRHHGPRSDSPITGTLTAQAVNGPVFVPKATVAILAVPTPPPMLASHELAATL